MSTLRSPCVPDDIRLPIATRLLLDDGPGIGDNRLTKDKGLLQLYISV